MKFDEIMYFNPINKIDNKHLQEIKQSLIENGWAGAPILVYEPAGQLITGSHRLQALRELWDDYENCPEWVYDDNIAIDVSDIIDEYCTENDCSLDELQYDCLSTIFTNTEIEQYKDDIVEW